MLKIGPNLFLISVLLIVSLACALQRPTTLDPNSINTAIAQTQTAAPGIPITGPESLTPTMTRAPSATPFPTFTLVVFGEPQLSVSVDTICRTGPGEVYDRVGVLRIGEVVEVVGRSADGNFWVIRNPDGTGDICWISGQNASLTGLTSIVPVFAAPPTPTPTNTRVPSATPTRTRTPLPTPTHTHIPLPTALPTHTPTRTPTPTFTPMSPPTSTGSPTLTPTSSFTPTASLTFTATPSSTSTSTPTLTSTPTSTPTPSSTATPTSTPLPGFTMSYSGMESCTGTGWWVEIQMNNTGGTSFESITAILSDTVTGTVLRLNSNDFTNRDGCSGSNTQSNLPPGTTRIVSLPVFTYDPTGHNLWATIILCPNVGQGGTCMAQTLNFTP